MAGLRLFLQLPTWLLRHHLLELFVFKLILAIAFNEQLGSDQAGFPWLTNL